MYSNEWKNQPLRDAAWATERQKRLLGRIGIETLYDMIFHLPFRYENRRHLESIRTSLLENRPVATVVRVTEVQSIFFNKRKHPKFIVQDEETRAALVGFNRPFLFDSVKVGKKYFVFAQFGYKFNEVQASTFDLEEYDETGADHFGKILPVYGTTEDMTQKELRKIMARALDAALHGLDDELPGYLLKVRKMPGKAAAVRSIHFPETEAALAEAKARLAYEEFLAVQLAIAMRRRELDAVRKNREYRDDSAIRAFLSRLKFEPTGAQERVIGEILADMNRPRTMCRLLQGDVGSGKTIVAASAMVHAAGNGVQSALMAPTEVLAAQHYAKLAPLFREAGVECVLLTGNLSSAERAGALKALAGGNAQAAIGTHALYSQDVVYKNLGLIVVDEQHKFGVEQRIALSDKGDSPDLLVMTATPIPRTLTLTLYGDLDVSLIDELPANRKPVTTKWIRGKEYPSMLKFIKAEAEAGHQAFIVYPLIDESNAIESRAAKAMHERLTKYFKDQRLGLVHGRMDAEERNAVMERFAAGELDILIATSIVEVGIDVPNATVIAVENAERFGLSQLHQLRGRVGRGGLQSYCFLVTGSDESEDTVTRMETMVRSNDGFYIAEEDLKLRGPGSIIGVRQSGMPELQIADYLRDEKLLKLTQEDAGQILKADPVIREEQNRPLRDGIIRFFPSDYLHSG